VRGVHHAVDVRQRRVRRGAARVKRLQHRFQRLAVREFALGAGGTGGEVAVDELRHPARGLVWRAGK